MAHYAGVGAVVRETSPATQEALLRENAERGGETIDRCFTGEDTSGRVFTFLERRAAKQLTAAVKEGVQVHEILVADSPKRAAMSADELATAQAAADESMRAHWSVVDGALQFDGKGKSLCTAKDYADFELHVDWKILEHGDSGIYLRGSPQVQIWDTSDRPEGSAGLFNNKENPSKPLVCADNPIGQWNSFRIKMIGEKVTIWLNGRLVVDEVVLENYWERDKPIYPSGQIELQNHGNTLYFKNVYIREIK